MPTPEQRATTLLRYKEKNADKIRERARLWAQANKHKKDKAKVAAYNKEYGRLNPRTKTPEQSSADQKRYYERHKERIRVEALEKYHASKHKIDRKALSEYNRAYRKANPEKCKATAEQENNRRAKRLSRIGDDRLTKGLSKALIESQNGCCNYCNITFGTETPHLDHVEPLSRGGRNIDDNIQLLCCRCNLLKGSKLPSELNLTELAATSIALRAR